MDANWDWEFEKVVVVTLPLVMVVGMFISLWFHSLFVLFHFIPHTIDYLFLIRLKVWAFQRVLKTWVRLRMKAALAISHAMKTKDL